MRCADSAGGGDLSNPDDRELVRGLEDTMIEAYGKAIVESMCKEYGTDVDLGAKMIRNCHVETLAKALVAGIDDGAVSGVKRYMDMEALAERLP